MVGADLSTWLQPQGERVYSPASLGFADPQGRVCNPEHLASRPARWVETRPPRSILTALGFKDSCNWIGRPYREEEKK